MVEKLARVYGAQHPDQPVQASPDHGMTKRPVAQARKTLLNDKGYQEVITYSFVYLKVQQMIHPVVLKPYRCQAPYPV
ncbi:hypothetical protein ACNKHN_08605 [Shigella flexneri]